MNRTHHYFTRALLGVCLLLCLLPNCAKAQLFGGMIKIGPSPITLASNQNYFVSSIYDTDYLPYTAPSGPATTATQAANGLTNDPGEVAVNVQGTITTTGVTVRIPCTTKKSGTLSAYSTTITIPAALTEDGVSRDLTLSWSSQAYTLATVSITAKLQAVGGTLNVKKLDINAGIGNDYLGVLLGQLVYPTNSTGATSTFSVCDLPGIPDKMFGLADNGGVVRHNFLYLPVVGEDGKVWLNNNLGADYANVSKAVFNPGNYATTYDDYHAYGSLFQWGRLPDGHELMTWSDATTGSPVNPYTTTLSNTPITDRFIGSSTGSDWRIIPNDALWVDPGRTNVPCPDNYRLATNGDYNTLKDLGVWVNLIKAASSLLHFTGAGYRRPSDGYWSNSFMGFYWSNVQTPYAVYNDLQTSGEGVAMTGRNNGMSVRCLKN